MQTGAGVGDRIEVARTHRLAGEVGIVVARGDNPHSERPSDSYHILFDRVVRGALNSREIWLCYGDFIVVQKAIDGYKPPVTLVAPSKDLKD